MFDQDYFMGAEVPVDLLDDLNHEAWEKAGELLPAAAEMIRLHVTKPWIENFKSIVISPLKPGLEHHLAAPVFEWEGLQWYYPSMDFWKAHAHTSHPGPLGTRGQDGAGCDVQAHVDFLTPQGDEAEFAYANILKSGEAYILGPEDFELECEFWQSFGPEASYST